MDKSNYEKWTCESGKEYFAPKNHCVFCNHCIDIFYDFSNGPYLFICNIEKTYPCNSFEKEVKHD